MTTNHPRTARPMRRAEREITDPAQIDAILDEAQVLYVTMKDEPAPYIVPLCFGRDARTLYVHSALAGTKIELLRAHPLVGFCAATPMRVVPAANACGWGSRARSVAGTATARIVEGEEERHRGLDAIMRHYAQASAEAPSSEPVYAPRTLERTCVIAFRVETLRAKHTG